MLSVIFSATRLFRSDSVSESGTLRTGTYRFRKHTSLQNGKNGPKKSAPECLVECGWVGQSLFGQCPNVGAVNAKGCSLNLVTFVVSSTETARASTTRPCYFPFVHTRFIPAPPRGQNGPPRIPDIYVLIFRNQGWYTDVVQIMHSKF